MQLPPNATELKRSLKMLRLEAALTGIMFSMPIINVFFAKELHMTMAQIGILQAAFTAIVIASDIPTGFLADKLSHRLANVIGDSIAALGFVVYALAHSFAAALTAEAILAIGMAISAGADKALLGSYCRELTNSDETYIAMMTHEQSRIQRWALGAAAGSMLFGSVIGAYNLRLTLWLDVPVMIGAAAISWYMVDSARRHKSHQHPLRDLAIALRYTLHGHKPLAWSVMAYAIGNETTHVMIWLLTPIMLMVGVPVWILGLGWAINLVCAVIGNIAASKISLRLTPTSRFGTMALLCLLAMAAFSVSVSLFTVCLYAIFGITRGWFGVTNTTLLQYHAPEDLRNTVASVASTLGKFLCIPAVIMVGALADTSLRIAMIGGLRVFAPLMLATTLGLRRNLTS